VVGEHADRRSTAYRVVFWLLFAVVVVVRAAVVCLLLILNTNLVTD
jgi:hypothetical protein